MKLFFARVHQPDPALPLPRLGAAGESECYALRDRALRWQVQVGFGEHSHVPFRETLVWEPAGVAVLGGGAGVHFLDLADGRERRHLPLPSLFGGLALVEASPAGCPETLLCLGWREVVAVERDLTVRWRAPEVAVDGVVFHRAVGPVVELGAEMDPPGGWVDVALDLRTGAELSRSPAPSSDPGAR